MHGLAELLSIEVAHARRLVLVAESVAPRVDLQGQPLPPRLPATAEAFADGRASLAHLQVIAALLAGATAAHLAPDIQAAAEAQIAARIGVYTPAQLRTWDQHCWNCSTRTGPAPTTPTPNR